MDATAVAGTRGLSASRVRIRDAALVGLFFGGFQAVMPAIGWGAGSVLASRIAGWGPWITFAVLGGLGAKMTFEAARSDAHASDDGDEQASAPITPSTPVSAAAPQDARTGGGAFDVALLAALALATSIDALAAGVTLALSRVSLAYACTVIGAVTFVLAFAAVHLGHRFGMRFGSRIELAGGLILIAVALHALASHLLQHASN